MTPESPVKVTKKVPKSISPFVLIVLESKEGTTEKIAVQNVKQYLLKEWAGNSSSMVDKNSWDDFDRKNNLLLDNEVIETFPKKR